MPKLIHRSGKAGFTGATVLAAIPVFAIFYILLILPFLPDDGKGRIENILFWPVAVVLTLTLVFQNWARIDRRFFLSLPIASLIAYLVFAAASVTWAYSPDFALSRVIVEMLLTTVFVMPYALPIPTKHTITGVYLCYAIALGVSAIFVLTTPSSPIGHPGYFTHKQELGLLAAVGVVLSSYELAQGGWRRLSAIVTMALGFWLVFASESKSALAFAIFALVFSWLIMLVCKRTRLTPAFVVAAVVVASMFVSNPIEKMGYRLYGDVTLTGRTAIWAFANYQISRKSWFGWGFHSYYFVPNSPQNEAPGYIREMPSSHSGYLDLKLETGQIGYWIFLVFIYSSLHVLERVRRKDPLRAWCYLSLELFAILMNLTDSCWLVMNPLWIIYLFVAADAVRVSLPDKVADLRHVPVREKGDAIGRRPSRAVKFGGAAP